MESSGKRILPANSAMLLANNQRNMEGRIALKVNYLFPRIELR